MSASSDTRPPVLPTSPDSRAAPAPESSTSGGGTAGGGTAGARTPVQLRSRHREGRRVLAWGLGISAFLHLILLLFASRAWFPIAQHGSGAAPAARPAGRTLPEIQALRLRVTDDATPLPAAEVPPAPIEERIPPRRTAAPVTPTTPAAPAAEPVAGATMPEGKAPPAVSPADRLRPGLVDPRLWDRAEAPPPPVKTDFEIARERVYARLEMLNDSAVAEADAAARATDWTFTDKDGKKWGVSPGKVHLGGVTLPLPIGFSPPPDQAKEGRERAARAGEIKDHADRARVRGTFEDQVKATREQRDRERAAKKDSTKAGGTE